MARKEHVQFEEALDRSRDILIAFRKEWSIDAVTSALALLRILEKKGKRVHVLSDGFETPKNLAFLPGIDGIHTELRQLQKFVVSLDTTKTALGELSYDTKDGKLHIYLTPKSGRYTHQDISTSHSDFRYDLIITVDTPDYASLHTPFRDHTDFFYGCPVVNIDHDPANEQYGNINLVDVTATSNAEMIYRIFKEKESHLFDEDIATSLLAGVVSKTRSFKTPNVTPNTLSIASELMAAGARQEEVMRNLYRTRSLATLKLWGRALARLKYDPITRMTWTLLVRQDFIHAGADEKSLPDIIDELIVNSPEADIIGLLYEQDSPDTNGVCAMVSSERYADALGLVAPLKPEGNRKLARIRFPNMTLADAERSVLQAVRASTGKQESHTVPDALVGETNAPKPFVE